MVVAECYCKIESESYSDNRININYNTKKYYEALKEMKRFNRNYNGLPDNIEPYITRRTIESDYRICIFDTRCQRYHISQQLIQANFKNAAAVNNIKLYINFK